MTLAPGLRPTARQRTALAPAMQGALRILRLPLADLQAEIAREATENPLLIHRAPGPGNPDALAAVPARPSLADSLQAQIGLMALPGDVRAVAMRLAADLREDGYLDADIPETAAELGVAPDLVAAGLDALQACEPAGVGARTLSECLALQLGGLGLAPALARAVVARLEGFVEGDWRGLTRALGLPRPELERIAALLPRLAARPVPETDPAPAPLLPDLLIAREASGALSVRLARAAQPRLALDRAMLAQAEGALADACRSRAEALIAAVAARGATLQRIGAVLIARQAAFFLRGPEHLHPLSRAEVAEALGVHPSTVGRAVAGKALAFEGRVLPLDAFFPAALPQAGGAALAGFVVRRRIAAMVAAEDPAAPLSDAALQARLADEGIDIARRTVAKYREWLRLPASHQRRRAARRRGAAGVGAGTVAR